MKFYVYVLFRPDGRPCYVGKGTGDRWLHHERKASNRHLRSIIAKAGCELPKVKIRDGLTEVEAFEIERAFIKAIGRRASGGPLVNMTDGGDGVLNPSDAVRAKMSAKAKARSSTPEWRARIRAINKGRKLSPEVRAKMSASHTGKRKTPEHQAAINRSLKGQKKPYLVARNIARTGISTGPCSDGRREAIRAAVARYWKKRREEGLPMRHPRVA